MKKHLPQLDGLRGIAVLIVLVGHICVFGAGFGIARLGPLPPLGVDLFFVLSGFLITNVLLESQRADRYYLNFYARRALRIWPLYAILLVFIFSVANHRIEGLSFDGGRIKWQYFALFVQNLVYPRPELLGPLALAVTWSVAVEEQFYAIWPVLVRGLSRRHLALILLMIVIGAPFARYAAVRVGVDPYINPLCRFDGMALGSMVALWTRNRMPASGSLKRVAAWLLLAAVTGAGMAWPIGLEHLLGKTFVSMGFCGFLVAALASQNVIQALSRASLRYIGKISYGIYLLHLPAAALTASLLPGQNWAIRLGRACIILVATIALATVSWYLVESRILRLKRLFADREREPVRRDQQDAPAIDDSVRQIA